MQCVKPIQGWRSKTVNPGTGKRSITFSAKDAYIDLPVTLRCGNCIGCRLDYSNQWALRCVHEAQMHEQNSFLTLTYSKENLPENHSIVTKEIYWFIKRLRRQSGQPIRYFGCGEYGDKNNRPHYHVIIFGYDFNDKEQHTITKQDHPIYKSKELDRAWKLGHAYIGDVTFESAAYVARYVMKKRKGDDDIVDPKTGKTNSEYYLIIDPDTGEIHNREKEFCRMSRKPGIGAKWIEKYILDTNKDYVTIEGKKVPIPKYYDSVLDKMDSESFKKRKVKRTKSINKKEQQWQRLEAKRKVLEAKTNLYKREI